MAGDGENWFLIFVTLVVTGLALVGNLYLLANYQHSEDRNQAWFPKIVVITGLTLAELSVLMLPLDVGNRAACSQEIALSACNFTMPMKELWYTVYMTMMLLITVVIPFSLFYYEGDSDRKCLGRWWDSSKWVFATVVVLTATVGIAYAIVGYVDYTVEELSSGMISLSDSSRLADATECIAPGSVGFQGYLCDATKADALPPKETWSVRTSFPVYVMALAACIGWVLFIVFAGVGVVALPVDLLLDCINFPRTIITKTEYVRRAKEMHLKSKGLEGRAKELHRLQSAEGKKRAWKKSVKKMNQELVLLEEEEAALAEVFPQGENPEYAWVLTVLMHYIKGAAGLVGIVVSICWILHIILYMFVKPPASPFLNDLFIELDSVWSLFGTAAFALFCFYLLCCVIKGNIKLGLNFVFITVHPMKLGGTLMSSFLFNVALIDLCSIAVIQFCASAFDGYANETSIQEIFGVEVNNLRGLKVLFAHNVFLYCFISMAGLTALYLAVFGDASTKKRMRARRANADTVSI